MSIKEAANLYIKAGLDVMTAIKKVAKDRKIPKNEVYKEYHKEEKIMKLVVGLGNPGKEYENTRHNIGYELADMFAKKI